MKYGSINHLRLKKYSHNLIRFHFAKEDATLNEALTRLETLKKKVNNVQNIDWR